MQATAQRIVESALFQRFIIGLILVNAGIIGAETSAIVARDYGRWLHISNDLILGVFILEIVLKMTARWPRPTSFFSDGWNVFDFFVVALALVPATGEFAMVARLLRLLRVVRLISAVPQLRLIVSTLIRSIPSMGHVLMLLGIIFYIYAVMGYHLFHSHDPTHWQTLGISLLTLFRVATLEDWTDVMYTAMELHPAAWIYFVSFVIAGTFVVINLFIAVILNNLEESKREQLSELRDPVSKEELIAELQETQQALSRLRARLDAAVENP